MLYKTAHDDVVQHVHLLCALVQFFVVLDALGRGAGGKFPVDETGAGEQLPDRVQLAGGQHGRDVKQHDLILMDLPGL